MNRIIGKKRVVILGFLFVCVAGGCSRSVPDVSYQIETDKPCQTMAYFSASDAWTLAGRETKPGSRLAVQYGE